MNKPILLPLVVAAALLFGSESSRGASATWGANGNSLWYTGSNWVGGAFPGIQSGSGGNSSDIATFTSAATNTTFSVDMGIQSLAIGAISIDSSRTIATNIGNNSHS